MDNDSIRIAEAMFPDYEIDRNQNGELLMAPNGAWDRDIYIKNVPNPKTSHADCHALIEWLNERGYEVTVMHWPESDSTVIVKAHTAPRFYDERTVADYRLGIVELTLKLLEKEDGPNSL